MKKVNCPSQACISASDLTKVKRFFKTQQFRLLDPSETFIANYLTDFVVFENSISIYKILAKNKEGLWKIVLEKYLS